MRVWSLSLRAGLIVTKRRHKVLIAASNQFCIGIVLFG